MASPHDPIFEEKVYLAFKDIFTGPRAEFRRSKAVLPIVSKYQNHSPVSSLLRTTSQQAVCESLCYLLKERVFQDKGIAAHRFATNPPIVAQPPSESGAVVSDVRVMFGQIEAPFAASLITTDMIKCESSELGATQPGSVPETDSVDDYEDSSDDSAMLDKQEMENLVPAPHNSKYRTETSQLQVSLPLRIQNLILSRVQAILELACFEFAKEKMPKILESRNWRCPKAGELNLWVGEFNKRIAAFENNVNNPGGYEISKCFQTATHIRHFAVHRRHLSTTHLQSLVNNAEGLCKILGNSQALAQIESIWGYAQAQISELESLKEETVVELESSLDDIAARRAELDLLEAASIAKAHDKLNGHHDLASDELEKILLDRHMVLMAAGKVEDKKEEDKADESDAHLSEELDAQPPEEAKVEQCQPPSGGLHILQQRIKQSMLLTQKIYNTLSSLPTCLHAVCNSLLLLSPILFAIAAAYVLGPGGMEHMWSVLWWGEW
ncbi:hypothetical protein NCS57_01163500 [Fusarium keratoplasticum]|uniref:Uncharacterized protein n=1 Tax=Fusarium keratoplasticum TaxID=1328300 RepID=A0ACC0QMM5_9HYPO|nr:hypothetical protein NCS57_01163500 [Fusarium keratoplasticum]KAI8657841.1 hypothetical protein NCS57_01163500 [Fusarium keratoplasticum]